MNAFVEKGNFLTKQNALDPKKMADFLFRTPIDELAIKQSVLGDEIKPGNQTPRVPLLLEIKMFRNLSRPYQRVTKN